MKMSALVRIAGMLALLQLAAFAQQSPTPPSRPAKHADAAPDPGTPTDGIYRNSSFGFSYKLPYGWVDRTHRMQDDSADPGKGQVLLAAFERPPEAAGNAVNAAVIIAAEPVSSYPGLKTAAQYFGPLTELTTAKGFKVVNQPYEFPVDARPIVRSDFSKPGSPPMYQSSLVLLVRGYALSFTFLGASEDDVTGLVESLTFGRSKAPQPNSQPPAK